MGQRLADLVAAVGARRPARVHAAATEVAHAALDLELRHRPVGDVDRDRLRLWAHQVVVDAAAGETAAVDGDVVVLEAIWARSPPAPAERAATGAMLADLRAAAAARELARISIIATAMAAAPCRNLTTTPGRSNHATKDPTDRRRRLALVAAGGAGAALAAGGDDDTPLTGAVLERASAAALEATGGGTVTETEAGDNGAAYGVEVRLPDGREVEVNLDEAFAETGQEVDDDGSGSGGDDD